MAHLQCKQDVITDIDRSVIIESTGAGTQLFRVLEV